MKRYVVAALVCLPLLVGGVGCSQRGVAVTPTKFKNAEVGMKHAGAGGGGGGAPAKNATAPAKGDKSKGESAPKKDNGDKDASPKKGPADKDK